MQAKRERERERDFFKSLRFDKCERDMIGELEFGVQRREKRDMG